MKRFVAASAMRLTALAFVAVVAPVVPAVASTLEEFLNAPVWYLEYEVSLTSAYQGSYEDGKMSFTSNLERVFSGAEVLNLRSAGPGPLSMTQMMASPSDGSTPSVADQQKATMKMLSAMDHTANWLVAGAGLEENAPDPTAGIAGSVAATRIDYTRVDTGRDLVDDMGTQFDLKRTTTIKGTGQTQAGGFGSVIFEMDTAEKSYTLTLPIGFNPLEATATREMVEVTQIEGAAPTEVRESGEISIGQYPDGLALDDATAGGMAGAALIRGVLDASTGKISGEQSFQAHYPDRNETAPGTLVFKYTLTMTPPKK